MYQDEDGADAEDTDIAKIIQPILIRTLRLYNIQMIVISKPKPDDAEGMSKVIKLSWYATYITPEIGITREDIDRMYADSEQQQIEVFRKRVENPKDDDLTLIAKEGAEVVGVVRLVTFDDHIRVRTFYVHPEYSGKGIGTSLWNEALKHLTGKPVVAWPAEHTRSIDFYKKLGFIATGEKELGEAMLSSGSRMMGIKMVLKR